MSTTMRHLCILLGMALASVWLAAPAQAALTFQLRTGDSASNTQSMIIDSNKCPREGPSAMYVGGVITNTGAAPVSGITVTLAGVGANVFLAGGQAAAQALGTLDAGEAIGVYWYTGYSCASGAVVTPTVQISSSLGSQSTPLTLRIREAISANAGGNVLSSTLGPGAVVGQTVYFDAVYDFGGSSAGDEFFLQPSGAQTFNAACFRLVGSQVLASNVVAAPAGSKDKLYFTQSASQSGNGYGITVRYSFEYQCAGSSTVARPYAVQTSGSSNVKYTGNYDGSGSIAITYPAATNPFTITKTISSAVDFVGAPGLLTYTVTVSNPSSQPSVISKIVDVLPAGMTFAGIASGSEVTALNSSSVPEAGASGMLTFLGKLGRSYALAAGGSVTLKYTATRPPGAGTFDNAAQALFGQAGTPVAQATYKQVALVALSATKTSTVVSDPVRLTALPLAIPGATVEYAITVRNPNALPIDANSVLVSDVTPANLSMCLSYAAGEGPVAFTQGSPASGLTYTFAGLSDATDALEFSSDGGVSWDYVPVTGPTGCDARITNFRIRPAGAFAASGAFQLLVRYRIL